MLDLNDVCVTFYPNTSNERIALDHLSFHIDDGDFTVSYTHLTLPTILLV